MMQNELLFFFSAVGVFNTTLFAFYLILNSKIKTVNFWIGIATIFISIRAGVACLYFFNQELSPSMIQLGLCSNLLSGVVLYISIKNHNGKIVQKDLSQFFSISIGLVAAAIIFPISKHFDLWDHTFRFFIHAILCIYVVACWKLFFNTIHNTHYNHVNIQLKKLMLISFTLVYVAFSISLYTYYIIGPILYSFIFYGALLFRYKFQKNIKYRNRKIGNKEA